MTGPLVTRWASPRGTVAGDPAVGKFREWEAAQHELSLLGRLMDKAQEHVPDWAWQLPSIPGDHPAFADVSRPDPQAPFIFPGRESLETFCDSIEALHIGRPSLERIKEQNAARLAAYDEAQARIDAALEECGYSAAETAFDNLGRRVEEIQRAILSAHATTLAGIICKLRVAAAVLPFEVSQSHLDATARHVVEGRLELHDRLMLSSLADAEKLAGAMP